MVNEIELRAFYTTREWARIARVEPRSITRLFASAGVPMVAIGPGKRKQRVVMVSDIKERLPQFWESVMLVLSTERTFEHGSDF